MLLQPLHFRQVQMMGANKLQNSSKLLFFLGFKTDISFHPDLFLASSDIESGGVLYLTLKGCFPRGSATLKTPSAELHILRSGNTSELIWGFCKGYSDHRTG